MRKSSLSSKAILKGHQEVLIFQSQHKKAQQVCIVVLPHLYVEFIVYRYVKMPKQHRLTQRLTVYLLIQAQIDRWSVTAPKRADTACFVACNSCNNYVTMNAWSTSSAYRQ